MAKGQLNARWDANGKTISVKLPLIIFEEEGRQIVFCPSLDLCGYGDTENEAFDSFLTTLGEYFLYTTHKGSLRSDLENHGWIMKKSHRKPMIPPDMSYLLSSNIEFNRVFNTHNFKKISHNVQMPSFA